MEEGNFAERFFGLLASDCCPDCGGVLITRTIKEETFEGGDGLTEFTCDSCHFKLVSCGYVFNPPLTCKCPRCGVDMASMGSD